MIMMHSKDPPTYYNIVDEDGRVLATVSKTSAYRVCRELQQKTDKALRIEPSMWRRRSF